VWEKKAIRKGSAGGGGRGLIRAEQLSMSMIPRVGILEEAWGGTRLGEGCKSLH